MGTGGMGNGAYGTIRYRGYGPYGQWEHMRQGYGVWAVGAYGVIGYRGMGYRTHGQWVQGVWATWGNRVQGVWVKEYGHMGQ